MESSRSQLGRLAVTDLALVYVEMEVDASLELRPTAQASQRSSIRAHRRASEARIDAPGLHFTIGRSQNAGKTAGLNEELRGSLGAAAQPSYTNCNSSMPI